MNMGQEHIINPMYAALLDASEEVVRLRQMVRKLLRMAEESGVDTFDWLVKNIAQEDMPWLRPDEYGEE
jgi:hypothetical protein